MNFNVIIVFIFLKQCYLEVYTSQVNVFQSILSLLLRFVPSVLVSIGNCKYGISPSVFNFPSCFQFDSANMGRQLKVVSVLSSTGFDLSFDISNYLCPEHFSISVKVIGYAF